MGEEEELWEVAKICSKEDMERYRMRQSGCGYALIAVVCGLVLGWMASWWFMIPAIFLSVAILVIYEKRWAKDEAIQRVEAEIAKWRGSHPEMIFVLQAEEQLGESAGHISLEYD